MTGPAAPGPKPVLAVRFDVDSITCIERGIPNLRRLADDLGVRFTFFVNMGYSFNWSHNLRHFGRRRAKPRPAGVGDAGTPVRSLPTRQKLGWTGVVKTVILNPRLGDRYRATFDALHGEGHELGLHGGTDHVIWQRSLDEMDETELEGLFRPAFRRFTERYGAPTGFACPGFRYNDAVLRLLDDEGFTYSSDMPGEVPFQPARSDGEMCRHFQVPVNVIGEHQVPVIEQGLARGKGSHEIAEDLVAAVTRRDYALLYGHPYVEGVHSDILRAALERVGDRYDVVTVDEYLKRWRARHG